MATTDRRFYKFVGVRNITKNVIDLKSQFENDENLEIRFNNGITDLYSKLQIF